MATSVDQLESSQESASETPSDAPESNNAERSGGGQLVWFAGGVLVAVHLVVFVALAILAATSDAVDARRGGGAETTAAVSEVITAVDFAYELDSEPRSNGNLEITLVNEGDTFHNLAIEGQRGFVVEANPGASGSETIELDDGVYVLFCSVPGHRALGMETTLTIATS